jgi:predicted MFS family arabinose efflux permease
LKGGVEPPALAGSLTLLLGAGAGLAAAALYYAQPMLGVLADSLGADARQIGWVPTLTQLGYALGIALLAPLGDRCERRRIILVKLVLLTLALLAAAAAPGLAVLLVASAAIGLLATVAQDFVPAAAILAPEQRRGKAVGTVMTGLLLGILLSRVVSGLVAEHAGWRAMFGVAALSIAGVAFAAWRRLPRFAPTSTLRYGALLASVLSLWRRHPTLRRAALAQGLLSAGFSAFWSTLAVLLHGQPYAVGSSVAGAYGLAGAAGALLAPLAGRLADRRGPQRVATAGAALAAAAFASMAVLPMLPVTGRLFWLAAVAVVFDLGVQSALIAHQTLVYNLDPDARSRLNAVLLSTMFVFMALGAGIGSALLSHGGWMAVTAFSTLAALGGLALARRR